MNDSIDPVVFKLDTSEVEQGVKRANQQVDGYHANVLDANKAVGDSFQRTASTIQLASDRNRSSLERISSDMVRLGGNAERVGQGIESSLRGVARAATGYVELAGAVGLATKAIVAHTQATSVLESLLNRARAARVGIAAATDGLGGAAAVGTQIAAILALEKIIEATYERGRELQRQALEVQRSGFSYQDTVALDFATKRQGLSPDFYNAAVKSAGGVDQLAQKLRELGEIKDPVEQVHQAFLAFGSDFDKMLPHLGERFGENITAAREWGLALDDSLDQRKNISQFIHDIDLLRNTFKGFTDDIHAFFQSSGNWFSAAFAGIWDFAGHQFPDTVNRIVPGWLNNPGFQDRLEQRDLLRGPNGTTQGMIADSMGPTFDNYAAQGMKYFQANRSAGTALSPLESSLFYTDLTSPNYGKVRPGSDFAGGYAGRALQMEQYTTGQRALKDAQDQKDADAQRAQSLKEIAAAQKSVDEIVKSSQLSELTGAEKLKFERADALKQYGKTKDLITEINKAFDDREASESKRNAERVRVALVDNAQYLRTVAGDASPFRNPATSAEDLSKQLRELREKENRLFEVSIANQQHSLEEDIPFLQSIRDNSRGRQDALTEAGIRIQGTLAGPGSELQTAAAMSQARKESLDREFAFEMDLTKSKYAYSENMEDALQAVREKYANEIAQLQIGLAEKVAETQRRQLDAIAGPAESLFHTLFTKPAAFGKQLSSTLKEATLKPISEGLGRMTAGVLQPVIYGADGKSGIAGMFKGMFGKDDNPLVPLTRQSDAILAAMLSLMAGGMGVTASIPTVPGAPPVSISSTASPSSGGVNREWLTNFGANAGGSGGAVGLIPGMGGIPSAIARIAPYLRASQVIGGGSAGAGGFIPGGTVSSTIDFGNGPISTGAGSYYSGGSASPLDMVASAIGAGIGGGFSGAAATGHQRGTGALEATGSLAKALGLGGGGGVGTGGNAVGTLGLGGVVKGLNGAFGKGAWLNSPSSFGANFGGYLHPNSNGQGLVSNLSSGPASGTPIAGMVASGGIALAEHGLLGNARGTWSGTLQGAAGGFLVAGPIGAAVGAAIGIGEQLAGVESPLNKAKREAKEIYGISISNQMANQLVALSAKYANNIDQTLRSPEVRQMLQLYSAGTGQKFPLSASTPHAGSLVEQGGSLYQAATYQYGNPFTYQSSLPVAGPSSGNYPTGGPQYVSLNVGESSTADLLEGRIASTVTPDYIQSGYSNALGNSNGRLNNSAMIQQPGLVIS